MKKWLKVFSLGHTKAEVKRMAFQKVMISGIHTSELTVLKEEEKNGTAAGNSGNWQQGCTG